VAVRSGWIASWLHLVTSTLCWLGIVWNDWPSVCVSDWVVSRLNWLSNLTWLIDSVIYWQTYLTHWFDLTDWLTDSREWLTGFVTRERMTVSVTKRLIGLNRSLDLTDWEWLTDSVNWLTDSVNWVTDSVN